jgi:hypothetical protein
MRLFQASQAKRSAAFRASSRLLNGRPEMRRKAFPTENGRTFWRASVHEMR